MNQEQLFDYYQKLMEKAFGILKTKNHDYAGAHGQTPFANFERSEAMGLCSTEQGILVRVIDKISRLSTFCASGTLKVENEGAEDAVLDVINYMILLGAIIQDKNDGKR